MSTRTALAVAAALSALAPTTAGASPARPLVALAAAPAHLRLAGAARQSIRVTNTGAAAVVVDVAAAGLALGAGGRPRALPGAGRAGRTASWLRIVPKAVALPPGRSALVGIASAPPSTAAPGDHAALVLVTTRPLGGAAIAVRMRIGVTVVMRVRGAIVHRLELRSLRARRHGVLGLVIANRGNVVETIPRGRLEVMLTAGGRRLARLRPPPRELLPHVSAVFALRYPVRLHGPVTARVTLACCRGQRLRRSLRVRL